MRSFKSFVLLSLIFSLFCLTRMAFAQMPDRITGMTLETNELLLNIGESYRFLPEFQTEEVSGSTNVMLHIYSGDENVVEVSTDLEEYNTIKAVGGGSTRLYLFSAGYEVSAVCDVTVSGPANETVGKDGSWKDLTIAEMKKLQDPGLKAFFEMLAKPEMANAAPALAAKTKFNALVSVSQGKADEMAALAEELGMDPVYAFPTIDTIGVTGTAEQFLGLLNHKNVRFITENAKHTVNNTSDRHMFEGQAETLSHISAAGKAGMTGADTVVVIMDTGIDKNHEQFTGKPAGQVLFEACFSYEGDDSTPVCANGTVTDTTTSAIGGQVHKPDNFEHGAHVAAIAAGKDGVAPGANIISFNIFYEYSYINQEGKTEYTGIFTTEALFRAFEYIKTEFKPDEKGHVTINGNTYTMAAINMSIGGGKYTSPCKTNTSICREADTEVYFAEFLSKNIIPVVAAGNYHYDKAVVWPACVPSAFTVGALHDSPVPEVANYSNHSTMVDIMAPGTQIYSALPSWDPAGNTYEAWNGTSMATPFVSGTFALLRQKFPDMKAADLKTLVTGTASQAAARAGIKKPVLDFAGIAVLSGGPNFTINGADKSLELVFTAAPFKTNYEIRVSKAKADDLTVPGEYVMTQKVSNPKKVVIKNKNVVNNQPYVLEITGEAVLGKTKVPIQPVTAYGMPMTRGKDIKLERANAEGTLVKFSWTPESWEPGNDFVLDAFYGPGPDDQPDELPDANDQMVIVTANRPFYATVFKPLTEQGITYRSLPTALEIIPLSPPKLIGWHLIEKVDPGNGSSIDAVIGGNGKGWLQYEKMENITGREVTVYTLNGALQHVSSKKLTVNTAKSPEDVLITGLKNGYLYEVCTKNTAKLGKYSYSGEEDCQYVAPKVYSWDPKTEYDGKTEVYWYTMNIAKVSVSTGSRQAVLNFNPDKAVDGFRFELKPLAPNAPRTIYDVKTAQAQGTYSFNKLTDGTVYKLRFLSYIKNGKLTALSSPYPDNAVSTGDASWRGLVFVPLPAPEAELTPRFEHPDNTANDLELKVRNNRAADGFTVLTASGSATGQSLYASQHWDNAGEYTTFMYPVDADSNTMVVMLYKDFNGSRYYGPALTLGDITNSDNNYSYGPKAADIADLTIFPEMRYAPQVDGQINFTDLTAAKSAEDAGETEEPPYAVLPDSFTVEFDENGSVSLKDVQIFYFDTGSDIREAGTGNEEVTTETGTVSAEDSAETGNEEESAGSAPKSPGPAYYGE